MTTRNDVDLPIHVKRYDEMDSFERHEFQKLVETGAEVTADGLSNRMKAAHLLGYVVQHDRLVAVGSLKHPAGSYLQKISQSSGYDLADFHAELGWIFVMPVARRLHLASRISETLCGSYQGSIFATTRSDNAPMQAILGNLGFNKAGREYESAEHPGKTIQLWVLEPGI